ncbi:hypothetical protein DSO57_1026690 [Entomophthora muscae]|uniref:Uncharacterized protein n=1 Tax=Entomophthora muscae TaxID=34485 RepID=A0ACC2T1V6_9FUNG|nr:hypothetical protein DSO57_1026690 [Entomophthora muscae]
MVRFRGKANARPVLASEKIEAEFKAKLASTKKENKTPTRTSKASPASSSRRSTRTPTHAAKASPLSVSRRSAKIPSQVVKTSPPSTRRRSTNTPSKKTPSRNLPKVDISDTSLASQLSTKRPNSRKPNSATRELDDYSIGGLDSDTMEDSHWEKISILNDSLPSLNAVGESAFFSNEKVVRVKKETEKVFPADDPFGFFQVEREVKEKADSKQLQTTPVKRNSKPKNTSLASAPKVETPKQRRSNRQVLKPSSYAQNKTSKRLPTINEKIDASSSKGKPRLSDAISKKLVDSQNKPNQRKPFKRSAADNEKLLQEERARLVAQFKVIDKFHLEEEAV